MRLTEQQIQVFKSTAHAVLGEGAQVTLFGSRVDDAKKGGDIDLLFTTPRKPWGVFTPSLYTNWAIKKSISS
jgi:hypothetical protein